MKDELIRVAIADDQELVRSGWSHIINAQSDMEMVGYAANGREAITVAEQVQPHVFLMDVQMPKYSGIAATRDIVASFPELKVIILTTFELEQYVFDGIRAGAVGYMLKDATPNELLEAIRAAHRGEAIYRTAVAAKVMSQVIRIGEKPALQRFEPLCQDERAEAFTGREIEVLQQMAYGWRNEDIASILHISESTVKTHVHRILQKLEVEDRTQAVVYALRNGIVQ
ncbi:response regulator transcription factor [Paenibacillus sp. chi10]|uniref:Response regulator transcription factor n=1 Tax=Paenibacillus suaedae TaxID=3077233 RepID=A0AAJ2JZL5_9BACL|nr:response regulator transcription factor [Paenibacillus sp. chi10]MDT8978831.1 response regulator transcription factor [Paenibacillus sp. chi10]